MTASHDKKLATISKPVQDIVAFFDGRKPNLLEPPAQNTVQD